jgi:hypothetical protein
MRLTPPLTQFLTIILFGVFFVLPNKIVANPKPAPRPVPCASIAAHRLYVEFCIINDIDTDFPYFLGGESQISRGTTRTFNYPEGTEIYRTTKGDKGKLWLVVTADMHKKTYKLSEIIQKFAPATQAVERLPIGE